MPKSAKRSASYTSVCFILSVDTQEYTEIVGLTGSHEEMGCWDSRKAAKAELVNGQWQVNLALPSREIVYYKWAVFHRDNMDMVNTETRSNRFLMVVPDDLRMKVYCDFNGDQFIVEEGVTGDSSVGNSLRTPKTVKADSGFYRQGMLPTSFTSLSDAYVRPSVSDERLAEHTEIEMRSPPMSAESFLPVRSKLHKDRETQTDGGGSGERSKVEVGNQTKVASRDQSSQAGVTMVTTTAEASNQKDLEVGVEPTAARLLIAAGVGFGLVVSVLLRKWW